MGSRSIALALAVAVALVAPSAASASPGFTAPMSAHQLIVVSSPTYAPANYLATLTAYQRSGPAAPWRRVFGPWEAEIGTRLNNHRHEGDHTTPTGVYGIGLTMYGDQPDPGGLHYAFHHLVCGDWWDEDPYSSQYSHFVHVACGFTPRFAPWSEALWTETVAYPYFAVIRFNMGPIVGGPQAPGAGIFLHSWVYGPTEGCVALPESRLLQVLRWLEPVAHPVIAIGTDQQLKTVTKPAAGT